MTPWKQPKTFVYRKWRCNWSQYSNQMVEEISPKFQKPWWSKLVMLKTVDSEAMLHAIEAISWVALGDYQASLASHCPMCFVIIISKSNWSGWIVPHVLPKYCKTFDSS